jgi:hypothetical protein
MAMTAMARGKNESLLMVDESNYRRILQAAHQFAAENNDQLPSPGWSYSRDCWLFAAGFPRASASIPSAFQANYHRQLAYVTNGQLFPYLGTHTVFRCPADEPDNLLVQRDNLVSSYDWNGAVSGYSQDPGFKLSQFRPDSVLQWEDDDLTPFWYGDAASFPDEGVSSRHNPEQNPDSKSVILGIFGGNVERVTLGEYFGNEFAGTLGRLGQDIPPELLPNRSWCNPATPDGRQRPR